MPIVGYAILWFSQVRREMNPQIIWNNRWMSKILPDNWNADLAMDDKREKLRMKEATNEMASLKSSLNLESDEMPIENYGQQVGDNIVDVENIMVELVDLAWGGENHLGLDLNEEPIEGVMWMTNQTFLVTQDNPPIVSCSPTSKDWIT